MRLGAARTTEKPGLGKKLGCP